MHKFTYSDPHYYYPNNETQKGQIYNITTWFHLTHKLAERECEDEEEQWFSLPFTFYTPGKKMLKVPLPG